MKKTLLFLIGMMMSVSLFAQYGTCTRSFRYEFRYLPRFAVAKADRTCFVSVESNSQISDYIPAEAIYNKINVEGWTKVDSEDAAFLKILLNLDFLTIEETGVKVTETEEKSGETTKKVKHFFGKIIYSLPYKMEFNSSLNSSKYGRSSDKKIEFVTEERKSYEDAKKYVDDNKDMLKSKIIKAEVEDLISSINKSCNAEYAYYATSENVWMDFLDSKKSEFYESQQKAIIEVREIFGRIKADSDMKQVAAEIQVYIDQFKEIADKLDAADKKQRKAKISVLESIATLYYAAENFDMAKQYAETLLKEYEHKKGGKMIANIDDILKDMQRHNLTSRHFEL